MSKCLFPQSIGTGMFGKERTRRNMINRTMMPLGLIVKMKILMWAVKPKFSLFSRGLFFKTCLFFPQMDADYNPNLQSTSKKKRKKKEKMMKKRDSPHSSEKRKKSHFAEIITKNKPVFDPSKCPSFFVLFVTLWLTSSKWQWFLFRWEELWAVPGWVLQDGLWGHHRWYPLQVPLQTGGC